jgi:hypothetical protein
LAAEVTVFYASNLMMPFSLKISKIGRLTPIVGETEEISDCRNLPFKSRAEFSDGSVAVLTVRRKNLWR